MRLILALVSNFLVVGIVVPGISGWRLAGAGVRLSILGIPVLVVGQASAFTLGIIAAGNSFEDATSIVVIGIFALLSGGYTYAVHPRP